MHTSGLHLGAGLVVVYIGGGAHALAHAHDDDDDEAEDEHEDARAHAQAGGRTSAAAERIRNDESNFVTWQQAVRIANM